MAIVKNIQEVTQVIAAYAGLKYDRLASYIKDVEEDYVKEVLGKELFNKLSEDIVHDDANKNLILEIAQPVVPLAFYEAAPFLDVNIGPGGFTVVAGNDVKPASQARTVAFRRQSLDLGHRRMDRLLLYIEENKGLYPTLDQSAIEAKKSWLMPNAIEFNEVVHINKSRFLFLKMMPIIREVERNTIVPILSQTLYDVIIASEKAGNTTAANKLLLPYLKRIIANRAFADALLELKLNVDDRGITLFNGKATETVVVQEPAPAAYIKELKESKLAKAQFEIDNLVDFLNANAGDYPGFETTKYFTEEEADIEGSSDINSGDGWTSFI